jgi:hypothetical protein
LVIYPKAYWDVDKAHFLSYKAHFKKKCEFCIILLISFHLSFYFLLSFTGLKVLDFQGIPLAKAHIEE